MLIKQCTKTTSEGLYWGGHTAVAKDNKNQSISKSWHTLDRLLHSFVTWLISSRKWITRFRVQGFYENSSTTFGTLCETRVKQNALICKFAFWSSAWLKNKQTNDFISFLFMFDIVSPKMIIWLSHLPLHSEKLSISQCVKKTFVVRSWDHAVRESVIYTWPYRLSSLSVVMQRKVSQDMSGLTPTILDFTGQEISKRPRRTLQAQRTSANASKPARWPYAQHPSSDNKISHLKKQA